MEELHLVTAVEVIGEFRLRLTFDDGTVGDVDYTGRVWPVSRPERESVAAGSGGPPRGAARSRVTQRRQ
jgi:hypothetical protein